MVNKYYQKNKERVRCENFQNFSEKEKDKRQKKVPEKYQNFTEEAKVKRYQYY